MSERARAARKELPGWLSGNCDNCEPHGFVRIGNSLLKSKAFQELSFGQQAVYLACCVEAGKSRQFNFPRKTAENCYGFNWSTAHPALKALERKGFIRTIYSGRLTREPSLYEFCFDWKSDP